MFKPLRIIFVLLSLPLITTAQNWNQVIKGVASGSRSIGDEFGYKVAIDGDFAIVGARREDEDANGANTINDAGAAYLFTRNQITGNWTLTKKLVASDRGSNYNFGSSVAISGNYLIVGATGNNAAYVFFKNQGGSDNWGQMKKLNAADFNAAAAFGGSVGISGDFAVIGAPLDNKDADGANVLSGAGAAYIFGRMEGGTNNWGQVKKIVSSDRAVNDSFGSSVAISDNYAIVGAPQEDHDANGNNAMVSAGSVYVFYKAQGGTNSWGQQRKLVPTDRSASDIFGASVSISGDYVAIGTVAKNCAYIFGRNYGGNGNWGQVKKLVSNDLSVGDWFGFSVSINNDRVIVGAFQESEDANGANTLAYAGSAYIFVKDLGGANNWGQEQKIVASDRVGSQSFGQSVAISGTNLIVSTTAESRDENGANPFVNAGAVYLYHYTATTLPVNLVSFSVIVENRGVRLSWNTASEQNNHHFVVERSINGINFSSIATINARGDGTTPQNYTAFDFNPQNGTNYYRLKQVDNDGKENIHPDIKSVNFKLTGSTTAKIFPNPVSDNHINIQSDGLNGVQNLSIFNLNGKELLKDQIVFDNGQASYTIKKNLAKGIYLLVVGSVKSKLRIN